jgi:hypothetical protein
MTETTTKQSIEKAAAELGLTMKAEFVPFSKSRSAGEKTPTLNWKVTLLKDGREVLTTDYSAGCAHCPSYKQGDNTVAGRDLIKRECETGHRALPIVGSVAKSMGMPIYPEFADVLHSLASDADVIDCGGFDEWADSLGYDTDSRKAEGIYRTCLEIALKLRNALGESGLATLREAVTNY